MRREIVAWIDELLGARLGEPALAWSAESRAEVATGLPDLRFANLLSAASRHARRRPALPEGGAIERAGGLVEGWNPERWTVLDLLRAGLVLSRRDLDEPGGTAAVLSAFRFADVGELCALYRLLPLLPRPEDYVWQAGEGCRSNMTEVFEAVATDSPFPARHFDDVAWRALVVKAVFVGAPVWRVWGLDGRLDAELARMALDLADERRSAGRPVPPQLWSCLGTHGGERAFASLERELVSGPAGGRAAAAYGLARAGRLEEVTGPLARESDPGVLEHLRSARSGRCDQRAFAAFEPNP